jgi:ribosomal protein L37AE/L43A
MENQIGNIYKHPQTGAVVKLVGSHETIYIDGIHRFVDVVIIKDEQFDEGMKFRIPEQKFRNEWKEAHQCDNCEEYHIKGGLNGYVGDDVWMCSECAEHERAKRPERPEYDSEYDYEKKHGWYC